MNYATIEQIKQLHEVIKKYGIKVQNTKHDTSNKLVSKKQIQAINKYLEKTN